MPFKIISVTGAHSAVGKTTLCSILLENLKGFGAIKFTRTELYTSVVDDETILKEKGKDTAIFFGSGAEKVVWIQSPGGQELEDALNVSLTKMTGLKGVVVEGNSPADLLKPHLTIFIIGGDGVIKPSALKVGKKADIVIINSETDVANPASLVTFSKEHAKIFRIDLLNKSGEIDKWLAYIQKYIV
ncbi:MAG: hypothetical protein HZB61_07640 [Nitrospirae bacterium]|nr:hypothetical protein [Nitrospirota bacterium]